MHHLHFNAVTIIVSAVLLWLLGAVWYSPLLFAKPWSAMISVDLATKNKSMAAGMISSFAGDLILCFALAHIVLWSGAQNFIHGAFIGFIPWLGFYAAIAIPQSYYEGRRLKLFAINGGYWLVGMMGAAGLLAQWR